MSEFETSPKPIKFPKRQEAQELFWRNMVQQKRRTNEVPLVERARISRERTADQLRRQRAETRAERDKLTGLLNRAGFDKKLDEEVKRARRSGKPLSLMFLDLNNMKETNDLKGHEAGDDLIRKTAKIIAEGREYEKAARWGGDEFAKLLPETTEEEALAYWERLNGKFQAPEHGISIVAGIVQLDPTSNETVRESWRLCDIAEKAAKEKSRSQNGANVAVRPKDLTNDQILAA